MIKRFNVYRLAALLLLATIFTHTAMANVSLPAMFTDNMVLQQKDRVAIWGLATPGKVVTVTLSWNGKSFTGTADSTGHWKVRFLTPTYGGPYTITVAEDNTITLNNILIGEVWFCSGQSNMQMPLGGWGQVNDYEKEIAAANYPNIRLLQVVQSTSTKPEDDVKVDNGGWQPCSPQYIANFSSVAYFFAREIYKSKNIPIGIIHSSWGGTVIEAWTSADALKTFPYMADTVAKVEKQDNSLKIDNGQNRPTVLYNAMVHPFLPMTIRGVLWYQGESNAGHAARYYDLFPNMIGNWREKWGHGDFPFYYVQLANFNATDVPPTAWAELREAQTKALALTHTGMATAIDLGDPNNVHPKNKQEVGRRLALIALAKTYGDRLPYTGPMYEAQQQQGDKIDISFTTTGALKPKDGKTVTGFFVAGADQQFHEATATIQYNHIVLHSDAVPNPVAVRYAWANAPVCNLTDATGLPAVPFRTDTWPLVTK